MSPAEFGRFQAKVDIESGGIDGCWYWKGCRNDKGYGQMYQGGGAKYAHRLAYEHFYGITIPKDLLIDHICMTRRCVNPSHLRLVDSRISMTENSTSNAAINIRKTHCKHDHEFTEDNTYIRKEGGRQCKTCIQKNRVDNKNRFNYLRRIHRQQQKDKRSV